MSDTQQANERPVCLLVLGMHRSGTSALTRVLNLLGAALPAQLLDADAHNEAGHWEPKRLLEFHEELLAEVGSAWWDWRPFDYDALSSTRREEVTAELAELLRDEYGDAPLIVVKDPRVCRFVGLFSNAADQAGYEVVPLLMLRNPLEVSESLAKRDGFLKGKSSLIWLRYVLDAEVATRGTRRSVVAYEDLLTDWQDTVAKMTADIGIGWPVSMAEISSTADEFLSSGLRHNRHPDDDLDGDPILRFWAGQVYSAVAQLGDKYSARETQAVLDSIRRAFNDAGPVLYPLFEEADGELAARAKKIVEQHEELARCDDKIALRDKLLQEAQAKLDEVTGARDRAALKNEQYENSLSWRITRPLRKLKRALVRD